MAMILNESRNSRNGREAQHVQGVPSHQGTCTDWTSLEEKEEGTERTFSITTTKESYNTS